MYSGDLSIECMLNLCLSFSGDLDDGQKAEGSPRLGNRGGRLAQIPSTSSTGSSGKDAMISSSTSSVSSISSGTLGQSKGRKARALFACSAEHESELSFEPNQIIQNVKNSREPGWLEGTINGKRGLIPANYVEYLS